MGARVGMVVESQRVILVTVEVVKELGWEGVGTGSEGWWKWQNRCQTCQAKKYKCNYAICMSKLEKSNIHVFWCITHHEVLYLGTILYIITTFLCREDVLQRQSFDVTDRPQDSTIVRPLIFFSYFSTSKREQPP